MKINQLIEELQKHGSSLDAKLFDAGAHGVLLVIGNHPQGVDIQGIVSEKHINNMTLVGREIDSDLVKDTQYMDRLSAPEIAGINEE